VGTARGRSLASRIRQHRVEVALALPLFAYVVLLTVAPIVDTIRLSLTAPLDARFPSLVNYQALFASEVFRTAVLNTVLVALFSLGLQLGVGLGVFVDRSTDLADGISYLEFVAPGLMAATAMQLAMFESSWPVLSAIKWDRQYHAMLATPLRVGDVLLGHQAFIAGRILMTATVYLVVITAFGAIASPLGVLAIPVALLVGLSFSLPIAAWAAHSESEASFVAIFRFLILPMFLFSGTFFPIEQLPGFLQVVALLTPTYHGVALARDIVLARADLMPSVLHLAVLGAFIVTGTLAALVTFQRALRE